MSPLFPHSAAWAVVAALLALLFLWHWQSAPEPRPPRIASPYAQFAPEERADRHGYDERAFVDDPHDCPTPPFARSNPSRRPLSDPR
jgi:hypothetical protein